jgi:hypothetical protein
MTNTRDKFSGGGGDVAPSPRSPALSGDGKKTPRTASVPFENCLTAGVQSGQLGTNREQIGNKLSRNTLYAWEYDAFHEVVSDLAPRFCGGPHALECDANVSGSFSARHRTGNKLLNHFWIEVLHQILTKKTEQDASECESDS